MGQRWLVCVAFRAPWPPGACRGCNPQGVDAGAARQIGRRFRGWPNSRRRMAGVVQKEGAMRHPQDRPGERPDRARGANMSLKLLKVVTDIKESGYANLTRLTVLKKWFETPRRRSSFGIFIATQAA